MTWSVTKEFRWSASHRLDRLPPEHKCHNDHGHNYAALVTVESETLDNRGFVLDFAELKMLQTWIDMVWDHRNLNEAFEQQGLDFPTTAEVLAKVLYENAVEFYANFEHVTIAEVTVYETDTSYATYQP